MNRTKANLIKEELINLLEKQTPLTNDSINELIKLIENKYESKQNKKDLNESLNYRVNKND